MPHPPCAMLSRPTTSFSSRMVSREDIFDSIAIHVVKYVLPNLDGDWRPRVRRTASVAGRIAAAYDSPADRSALRRFQAPRDYAIQYPRTAGHSALAMSPMWRLLPPSLRRSQSGRNASHRGTGLGESTGVRGQAALCTPWRFPETNVSAGASARRFVCVPGPDRPLPHPLRVR